tara:strand:- start:5657 stop:5758 length:102 start_codon:yes stop_codon:yes gene_type:complete
LALKKGTVVVKVAMLNVGKVIIAAYAIALVDAF